MTIIVHLYEFCSLLFTPWQIYDIIKTTYRKEGVLMKNKANNKKVKQDMMKRLSASDLSFVSGGVSFELATKNLSQGVKLGIFN